MFKLYQYPLIFLGLVVGVFLFYAGCRSLFRKNAGFRGSGVFVLTVAFVLALLGGELSCKAAEKPAKSDDAAQPEKPKTFKEKVKLLVKTDEWKAFKEFWQELDKIDTFKKAEGEMLPNPLKSKDDKVYKELSKKLKLRSSGLDALAKKKLFSDNIAALMKEIARDRLENIHVPDSHRLCRAPKLLLNDLQKPKAFSNLEERIDILLKLKEEDKINEDAYKKAENNINKALEKIVVFELIQHSYILHLSKNEPDVFTIIIHEIESMKKLYKNKKITEKRYKAFKKKLDEFGISLDSFDLTGADVNITDQEKGDINELIKKLGDETWAVRDDATKKLAAIGRNAIPFLTKALSDEDAEVKERAKQVLESTKTKLRFEKLKKILDELNCLVLELSR